MIKQLSSLFKGATFRFILIAFYIAMSSTAGADWDAAPGSQTSGSFWRLHWYERGLTNGNPKLESRFRANSPEVVLHPQFGKREEARANGLMMIFAEEDLSLLTGAELYLETWGGHPGTANKRVTINGRSTYFLPRVGTEEQNCTYSYPSLPLKINDLVNGWNAFQFALDQGTTFWGHMIIDNGCLREALTNRHPDLVRFGIDHFSGNVEVLPAEGRAEFFEIKLSSPEPNPSQISSIDFEGYYTSYDENGNTLVTDWHGFTKARLPQAILGFATNSPFAIQWDTSMLPAQKGVAVRAMIHFKIATNIVYLTAASSAFEIPERKNAKVALYSSRDLPYAFWSRANQKKSCTINLDVEPKQIERAELHVNAWTGGPGKVRDYFTLNGHFFPVAEGSHHELIYNKLPVKPDILRLGANRIDLVSDTEHHGIEIPLPGPCLMVRFKTPE